jgi:hypothetical protein
MSLSMNDLHRLFWMAPVGRSEHLSFNLLEFRFFRDSERGAALLFGNHWLFSMPVVIPYILSMEVILFKARRHFIMLKKSVVGVAAFHEKPDSLLVASLGVACMHAQSCTTTLREVWVLCSEGEAVVFHHEEASKVSPSFS